MIVRQNVGLFQAESWNVEKNERGMVYNNARTRILHVKFCPFISAAKIHCLENVVRFAFHAIMILVFKIFCVTVIVIVKNVFYNQTSPKIYLFDIFFSLFEIQLFLQCRERALVP